VTATRSRRSLSAFYDAHGEKVRFLVVGVGNTILSYALFLVLLAMLGPAVKGLADSSSALLARIGGAYYLVVQWVGWAFMVPVSTTTMKYFAFRSPGKLLPQMARSFLVYLPAQGLSSLILWVTVHVAGLQPQIGQLITIAIVTVFTFLGHKYFTFRHTLETAEFGDVMAEEAAETAAQEVVQVVTPERPLRR
jgi:putative flippase GtrA